MAELMSLDLSSFSAKGILGSMVLVIVGVVFSLHSQFAGSQPAGPGEIYLKCANKSCDYARGVTYQQKTEMAQQQIEKYQAQRPEYVQQLLKALAPGGPLAGAVEAGPQGVTVDNLVSLLGNPDYGLGLTCPQCGQDAVFLAHRCPKCGEIFFTSPRLGGQGDKCPRCGFSETEQKRKQYQQQKKKRAS